MSSRSKGSRSVDKVTTSTKPIMELNSHNNSSSSAAAEKKMKVATADQIRLAQITENSQDSALQENIEQFMAITGKDHEDASIILHDHGNDLEAAVNATFEGDTNLDAWHETTKKKKTKAKIEVENKENRKNNQDRERSASRGRGGNAPPTPLCSTPCCSPLLTSSSLLSSSRLLLESHVSDSAERLSESLSVRATALRESLVSAVSQSESETMEVFHSSYPRLISMIEPVIKQLFADLSNFITDTDADSLELTLSKFWDDMFPMVYHSAVHTKMAPFTQQYSDCVAKSQRTIRPWGIVPTLVNEPLTRAIHSSTILLHSLHVANKVLQSSPEWFKLPPQCGATATRAFGCSLCSGNLEPPCPGLCLNVARGCLSPLSELSGGWRDWLNGVARAGRAVRNSHTIFKRLPEYLPDAILVAMETGPKLQKKVKRQCGPPSHETNSTTPPPSEISPATSTSSAKAPGGSVRWTGDLLIKQLVKDLYSKRDWWNNLSENFCQNSTSNSSACWNGQQVAEYKSDIANIGLSAQKYNPELQITTAESAIYGKADSLRGIKRLVLGHTSWLPESDSQRREEVARGSDYENQPGAYGNERGYDSKYNSVDDEDTFDEGSAYGSGDWSDPQTDLVNPFQEPGHTNKHDVATRHRNVDNQMSGVEGLRSSVLPTVIASVLTIVYALH